MPSTKTITCLALSTLLGLTLAGTLSAIPASANDNWKSTEDKDMTPSDPMSMSYPQAAPGAIHLYHWKDYAQSGIHSGSASDMRWENERKRDKERHERMEMENAADGDSAMYHRRDKDKDKNKDKDWDGEEMMYDPAPLSYPQAPPGGRHLYHWKDYTQTSLEAGSGTDKRWENEHKRDKERHERMERDNAMYHRDGKEDWDGNAMMYDPAPMTYPQAAPGSVHLYHWKDYTETSMGNGSAPDKRSDNEHKKDKARHEQMKQQKDMNK